MDLAFIIDKYKKINYFKKCLQQLDKLKLDTPVAMPFQIGCGLAGGDWTIYKQMLEETTTQIILYKL